MPKANYGMRAICNAGALSDLYIGSSMFRQGIDTKGLGEHTYLLAYNSNRPFHEAMQLKNLLDNGAKFDRLIVDMYPYSMTRDAGISDVKMIMDGDMAYTFKVYAAMKKEGYPLSSLYDMLILQNNELFITLPISFKLMNSRYERGSNTTTRHGREASELEQLKPKEVSTIDFNRIQVNGINDIIDICRNKNKELVFLETPKYYIINNDSVYIQIMKEYAQLLSDRGVKMILYEKTFNKIADVVDREIIETYDFDDENPLYYLDLYHISYEGRQVLTKTLVNQLNK